MKQNTTVWWIRKDLRLADNPALARALQESERIASVFILDPVLLRSPYVGEKRLAFLFAGLSELDQALQQRGGRLIVREGEPVAELGRLLAETGAQSIYAEPDFSPYARQRDARASTQLPVHWTGLPVVHPPEAVLKPDGTPYTVFTPFRRRWESLPFPADPLPAPGLISALEGIFSLPIPQPASRDTLLAFPPGEAEALRRLGYFTGGRDAPVYEYQTSRNLMGIEGTSQLSPYLRFGMLSPHQAVHSAINAIQRAVNTGYRASAEAWLSELIWREFYLNILYHFPHVRGVSFRTDLQKIAWRNDPQEFAAWCAGQTGYPIVDAAQRELIYTGWMHNRARMISASFLTKDLLIDWRWGEQWFMQHLIDGDPSANNGGWQWTAGTGTDAAPYFRVFNPILQAQKFDPLGEYVRRWVPELALLPNEVLHEPWKMSASEQSLTGCVIGRDYPERIVDHDMARQRALKYYQVAKTA